MLRTYGRLYVASTRSPMPHSPRVTIDYSTHPRSSNWRTGFAELRSFLETRYVQEPDRPQLTSRFRYLIEAAHRGVGRIDWLNIFIAQMLTMAVSGVIPSTAWGDAMRMAATLFHSLIAVLKALGT